MLCISEKFIVFVMVLCCVQCLICELGTMNLYIHIFCCFVLCILMGSLCILFGGCHFCCISLFMDSVLLCFVLYSVF
jgi:hypothetical protein